MNKAPFILLAMSLTMISFKGHTEATVVDITNSSQDLAGRVARMENMLENRGILNILNEVETLNNEVRQLRGQVEEQAYTIKQMQQRQQSLYDDLDSRIRGGDAATGDQDPSPIVDANPIQQGTMNEATITPEVVEAADISSEIVTDTAPPVNTGGIQPVETYQSTPNAAVQTGAEPIDTMTPQNPAPIAPTEVQATTEANPDQAESDYAMAFSLLKEGKHEESVTQFRTFLQNHPNSDYADNAQYWLGESFYARRQYQAALTEYEQLLRNYPDSGKASHAQLKIGYCNDELGNTDLAQGELEDLIARYPGTSAAQLADERLNMIRSR